MDITLTGQLHEEIEPNNPVDNYAVAVKKWENSWASTIIKEKKKRKICKQQFSISFELIRTKNAVQL